jgi:muramoyltetrapeptide carboxypeptidase
MKTSVSKKDDTIGLIAPSRPIYTIEAEVKKGISLIQKNGFAVKVGENFNKHFFYSAGTSRERISDIHEMFLSEEVRAIICATGGASSNQLIDKLDYRLIKQNSKPLLGYSDTTSLLLAIYSKTKFPTLYGPTVYDFPNLTATAREFTFDMLTNKKNNFNYPSSGQVWRSGKANGKLVGGVLSRFTGLLATPYMPDLKEKILFWEEVGVSPAEIDFLFGQLRLAGVFDKINGMIIGHLSGCVDTRYPQDNRSIKDIVLEVSEGYDFPILKVDYFGHDIKNFYTLPIGYEASLNAGKKTLSVSVPR